MSEKEPLDEILDEQLDAAMMIQQLENNEKGHFGTPEEVAEEIKENEERLKPVGLERVIIQPQLPLVRLKADVHEDVKKVFKPNHSYLVLGEIAQMPGHITLVEMETGAIFTGYHVEDFELIPPDEV